MWENVGKHESKAKAGEGFFFHKSNGHSDSYGISLDARRSLVDLKKTVAVSLRMGSRRFWRYQQTGW